MDSSLNDKIFLQLIFSYKNDTLTVCFGKEDSFIRKKDRAKLAAVAGGDVGISYCQEVSTAGRKHRHSVSVNTGWGLKQALTRNGR